MTIQIGESQFETTQPSDLAAQLFASTGCSVEEVRRMILGDPMADLVARALAPFLAEPPVTNDLAIAIREEGTLEVAAQVAALLDEPAPAGTVEPPAETVE